MRAVVITSPGGPEVLQVQGVEDPEVGENEVLIGVEAAALNRADTVQRKGMYQPPKGASPYPGLECSGTVIAVGKSVDRWKVGDQVTALAVSVLRRKYAFQSVLRAFIQSDPCWRIT